MDLLIDLLELKEQPRPQGSLLPVSTGLSRSARIRLGTGSRETWEHGCFKKK